MSKHNYSQYSNKKKSDNVEEIIDMINEDEIVESVESVEETVMQPEVKMVEETVETVALPEIVTGVVDDCCKLNVRVAPVIDADVVCVLEAKTEVEINVNNSTDDWFRICTPAGIEGYCMRKFVKASL